MRGRSDNPVNGLQASGLARVAASSIIIPIIISDNMGAGM
jgi:hypothetical protein